MSPPRPAAPLLHAAAGALSGPPRTPSTAENPAAPEQSLKGGEPPAWAQEPSEGLHAELLELHEYDYSCEEQMVPASAPDQPYRSHSGHTRVKPPARTPR